MARINAYEFDYAGKHYRWDRSTLRSPEGRAEIQQVLTARVNEIRYELGWKAGYQVLKDIETAGHVLEALALPNGGGEAIFRAIEDDISEKMQASSQEENEMAETKSPNVDVERVREMIKLERADPELRRALLRNSKDGLTPRQAAQFAEYKALESQNNEIAFRERQVKSGTHGPRPYIPSDAMTWITNPQKEQRRQLAAEWKAKTLANPEHDYWHPERGALSKSARLAMKAAYEASETGEVNGVHINPQDGSISEGEE